MSNVIIGIHGLGNKPPPALLEEWWKLSLTEGLHLGGFRSSLPPFEMAYWADIIYDKPLDISDNEANNSLNNFEAYTRAPENFVVTYSSSRRKVMDIIGRQLNRIFLNEDLSLNYSFLTDAILRRYFRDLEIYYFEKCANENGDLCMMKDKIRNRLADKLEKHKNDNIMLVSHSMGSIIAFDVLTFVVPHLKIDKFITMGSPLGLPVIISKIAAEQKRRFNGENLMRTPPSVHGGWHNFSDILDKIAFNYMLADDFTENHLGVKPVDHLVVNNYMHNGVHNPHKSFGYLRTSEFSAVLNEFILSEKLTLKQKVVHKTVQILKSIKKRIYRFEDK